MRKLLGLGILALLIAGAVLARDAVFTGNVSANDQKPPFKQWPAIEYDNFPLPPDYKQPAGWTRARLRYSDIFGYPDVTLFERGGRPFPGYWTMDYPRSDRHLLEGVRRLTRIDSSSVEQVVSLDGSNDIYNFPAVYAVEVGHWRLDDRRAAQLREFFLRGGFLMVDDFHGSNAAEHDRDEDLNEWQTFVDSMNRVLPGRAIEDLPDNDPIFHTIYDLGDRFQVPGAQYFETGRTYENGPSGKTPHWRAIRDDRGRVIVAICHNMDLGDAWEHSDEAEYLEKWAGLAYKIAMNYFVYDLTH